MAADSDVSDFPADETESDDDSYEEGEGDLSHLGAAATTVKFQSVKQKSCAVMKEGTDKLAQQILESCELSDRTLVPKSRFPEESEENVMLPGKPTTVIQQNYIQVQQQFGDVAVQGTRNLTIGGTQNISQGGVQEEKIKKPTLTDRIMKRTISRIRSWTKGMVTTSALKKVMEKLDRGTKWVTIKGGPGEGKSTVAYMALDELHRSGRNVFQVISPEEFSEVSTSHTQSYIMLDDILGDLEFDHTEWLKWKSVLHQVLDEKEHRSHEEEYGVFDRNDVTVLMIGRDYVLNSALVDTGRLSNYLKQDMNVVDMSHSVERDIKEKLEIWKAIVEPQIELKEDIITNICKIKGQHGFPHVCRLFTTIHKEDAEISAASFFQKPLEFLNQTIEKFMQDEKKLVLFKEMMSRGGEVSVRELGGLDGGAKIIKTAGDLVGTYLKKEDDWFLFDHPSVYDSVAYNLCQFYPLFVIENCDMTFIHERLRLQAPTDKEGSCIHESRLVTYISRSYIGDLARRFAAEISKRNLLQVLSHRTCADEEFVEELMSKITIPVDDLLSLTDKSSQKKFLRLIGSSGSPQLLKYINERTDTPLNQHAVYDVMIGVCSFAAVDVLMYLTQTFDEFGLNIQFGIERVTPLMIAAETEDKTFVHKILDLDPDLNKRDTLDRVAFHYLCWNGLEEAAVKIIDRGNFSGTKDVYGRCPLYYACKWNKRDVVSMLLKRGSSIDAEIVRVACEEGNLDVVTLLFQNGAGVNMASKYGSFPLHAAAAGGHVKVIKFLIDKGASVNKTGRYERTPLHIACMNHRESAIQCLIENAAIINSRDSDGETPLHKASLMSFTKGISLLLDAEADVDARSKDGTTPLLNIYFCFDYKECAELLLQAGGSVNAQDNCGNTALHKFLSDLSWKEYCLMLLRYGANVNLQNKDESTPLHTACANGFTDCITLLLNSKADVTLRNKNGFTGLHVAVINNHRQCLNVLLKAGMNINSQSRDGDTALHLASARGYSECVHQLITTGGDVNMLNNNCFTALHHAVQGNYQNCVRILLNAGADVNLGNKTNFSTLHTATKGNNLRCVSMLLKAGADVNKMSGEDCLAPLHIAVKHREGTELLLKNGANVNQKSSNGSTPLHAAVDSGYTDSVYVLLRNSADVSVQRDDGYTPLHIAVELGYCESVDLLLKSKACVNSTDKRGQTPLHKAANLSGYVYNNQKRSDEKICLALINYRSEVNKQDKNGNTVLHLLCQEEEIEMYDDGAVTAYGFKKVYERVIGLLCGAGADMNITNNSGEPALCVSCREIVMCARRGC